MASSKMKISLDSNIFGDLDFIEWLQIESSTLEISLSVIVYLETFHWYNLRGIKKELFDKEIETLNATICPLASSHVEEISNNSLMSRLPFKYHIRDIIIATHAINQDSRLITLNTKHFEWMTDKPFTPEELVQFLSN